jgi:NADPH:quinone reductase-like Zn-dependent oxidoreductase
MERSWFEVRAAADPPTAWRAPHADAVGANVHTVHSVALNPVGYKLMQTLPSLVAKFPANPESDLSGWVVDANGSQFVVGDGESGRVFVFVRRLRPSSSSGGRC